MSFHAVNPAASHCLSPCIFEPAERTAQTCNGGGELRASCEGHANSNRAAFVADFRSLSTDENFAPSCVCRYVSRLLLGHRFGAFRRPAALGLLLRIARPLGSRFLPKQVCKVQQKTLCKLFLGPSQKADLRHLGAGPTRQLRST